MRITHLFAALLVALGSNFLSAESLRIAQVAGGCCHQYPEQMALLEEAFHDAIKCSVDTFVEGTSRDELHSKLQEENWSAGYDAALVSLCFGHVKDDDYILGIVEELKQDAKGLVFIHCSLHNFRSTEEGTGAWRSLMGLTSIGHEKRSTVAYEATQANHPIMQGFPKVVDFPGEEVYKIMEAEESVVELARAYGPETEAYHTAIWVAQEDGRRVFGTSIGHSSQTYERPEFVELVVRGTLWTVGMLNADGTPMSGLVAE